MTSLYTNRKTLLKYTIVGTLIGGLIGILEYIYRIKANDDPQVFVPLLIRASWAGASMIFSVAIFESFFSNFFRKKSFLFIVLFRSIVYTVILSTCLFVVNLLWYIYNEGAIMDQLLDYFQGPTYLINLVTALVAIAITIGFVQINKLHRQGELFNFIIGKYHAPREVDKIFCFIDLKNSTTIAEKLGHARFASFLKDYYSDITQALTDTKAQIYQYVGDEIILSWSTANGLKDNHLINCFFIMRKIIEQNKEYYLTKYGFYPQFRGGLHGGKVIITWIGEIKKEIVFIGDVLNTTARIRENCKRVGKDFLISEKLLLRINDLNGMDSSFVEEIRPRGKEERIRLYSLELHD